MKNAMKTAYILLALILSAVLVLTGCGGTSSQKTADTTQQSTITAAATAATTADPMKELLKNEVKLKMYLLGDTPAGYDDVYGELNKLTKRDLNATIEAIFIPWGDVATKYPLLFASGEAFDLVYAANWNNYVQEASKGGFMELTEEMIQKYMPVTWERGPKEAWSQSRVNGKIYMIPQDKYEIAKYAALIRGDLREKYSLPKIATSADLVRYLETVAANEKELLAYNAAGKDDISALECLLYTLQNEYASFSGLPIEVGLSYKIEDDSATIINKVEDPKWLEFLKLTKDMYDKGVWSKNAISNKITLTDSFQNGKSALYVHNVSNCGKRAVNVLSKNSSWKPEIYDVNAGKKIECSPFTVNGMCIAATSKNVERSLMLVDKLRYDREYFDLTYYGVPGKHWEAVGENKYKELQEGLDKYVGGANCPWGWASPLERESADYPDEVIQLKAQLKKDVVFPVLQGYTFNDAKVKNEIAAIVNVYNTYEMPLMYGMVDTEKGLATLKDQLKKAGIDVVIAEVRAQADEYLKSQK